MQYSTKIRKKDNSYQYIITYKDETGKWKTKSKQGYILKKEGKELAQSDMDDAVKALKIQIKNPVAVSMKKITFEKFVEKYLEHMKLYRTYNTTEAYKYALVKFKPLNDTELAKITLLDIQGVVDSMTVEGLNANTIQDYIRKLSTILQAAKSNYNIICDINFKKLAFNKLKEDKDKRALNANEEKTILNDFKNSEYFLIILIALSCGLRIGEIIGLTWDNVDLENELIKVTRQWKQKEDGDYDFGTLKTKNSYRQVPIPHTIIPDFKAYQNLIDIHVGRLFFKIKNTASVGVLANAELKKYNITLHGLRHTYGTKLFAKGMDPKTAAEFMGHDVQEYYKTYVHTNDDMRKKAIELINKIL